MKKSIITAAILPVLFLIIANAFFITCDGGGSGSSEGDDSSGLVLMKDGALNEDVTIATGFNGNDTVHYDPVYSISHTTYNADVITGWQYVECMPGYYSYLAQVVATSVGADYSFDTEIHSSEDTASLRIEVTEPPADEPAPGGRCSGITEIPWRPYYLIVRFNFMSPTNMSRFFNSGYAIKFNLRSSNDASLYMIDSYHKTDSCPLADIGFTADGDSFRKVTIPMDYFLSAGIDVDTQIMIAPLMLAINYTYRTSLTVWIDNVRWEPN